MATLLVAQAATALEVDPYIVTRPGGVLWVPPRSEIHAASAATAALPLAAALLPARWRPAASGAALVAGLLALLVSCPVSAGWAHLAQVLLLGAALCVWIAGLARADRARHAIPAALFVLVALAAEGAFSLVARSHAVGYTLAARQWFARHWGTPSNSLGYRDV